LNSLFGKILRLNVSSLPYKIPASYPFANQTGKVPVVWDYGMRNPWRISFDRKTHDLYIADVGQNKMEELDVEPAGGKGGNNYGWRCFEGSLDYNLTGCMPRGSYIFPALEYDHSDGRCAIIGGYVYRGQKYPALNGKYFYADACNGDLYWGEKKADKWQSILAVKSPYKITTFGEDKQGEVYMADSGTGSIYQIEDSANPAR
jgi:glucose/arabinose dehydrogenase